MISSAALWETNIGTPLSGFLPDYDDGMTSVDLGFNFPLAGQSYSSVQVVTNGFMWLGGSNGTQCCVLDNEADALTYFGQGSARIAPAWYDLDPAAGGAIYFNSLGSKAVFTYLSIPPDASNVTSQFRASFQTQLFDSGMVIFSYGKLNFSTLGTSPATLIGLTAVNSTPVAVDLTNLQPGLTVTTTSNSVYDYLSASTPFDLSGKSMVFTPAIAGGWDISTDLPLNALASTPEPGTFGLFAIVVSMLSIGVVVHRQRYFAPAAIRPDRVQ